MLTKLLLPNIFVETMVFILVSFDQYKVQKNIFCNIINVFTCINLMHHCWIKSSNFLSKKSYRFLAYFIIIIVFMIA